MIVRLNGGLGNQMFQYAFGQSVSIARCEPVFYHKFALDNGNHRAYGLDVFHGQVEFKEPTPDMPIYQERTFAFDKGVLDAPPNSYFIGNWQTERYFLNKIVCRDLTPRVGLSVASMEWKMRMLNKAASSCSLHVRRSDYLNVQHYHGLMGMDYYNEAVRTVREAVGKVRFFVFSDDISWCRDNFPSEDFFFVDCNGSGDGTRGPSSEHEDLQLMAFCDHAIIPNSSFGWWGAWLGDKVNEKYKLPRMVVAPKNWFNPTGQAKHLDTSDIVPQRWVRI